jgi:retron-type reverse transcriptase
LYKNKGLKSSFNNYRGISVLPPIAKIFEKILAMQITIYLNLNNILFSGQHGFRNGHSCETALHELISYLNENRNSKAISLLLFIDFRKAFDLVDSKKLLRKLFHYGFDNSALDLIANYFTDRQQTVKYDKKKSPMLENRLGVPQGSVLGPLFFLLMINDLAYILDLMCKLFADDTTLGDCDKNLNTLINRFKDRLKALLEWCEFKHTRH